jgi:5'-nucleotidase
VYLSGTVAAAREAAFYGIPAVALSQYISPERHLDCDALARRTEQVLAALLERATLDRAFWNVNFPDISPACPTPKWSGASAAAAHCPTSTA